jgi:hypothetical protein
MSPAKPVSNISALFLASGQFGALKKPFVNCFRTGTCCACDNLVCTYLTLIRADAILESHAPEFNNPPARFAAKRTHDHTKRRVLVEALGPKTGNLLGFILFEYSADGYAKQGMKQGIKIVNFGANLHPNALGTGASSKRGKQTQAGQHGEGLKVAALVLRRWGYNVRIESSGLKWEFNWKQGKLACKLRRIPDETIEKQGK